MVEEIGAEKLLEVSAKTGANLKQLFQDAVAIVLAARKANSDGAKGKDEKKSEKEDSGPELKVYNASSPLFSSKCAESCFIEIDLR